MRSRLAKRFGLALIVVFVTTVACAGDIVPIGPDTYLATDSAAFASQSSLKAKLARRGASFCSRQGKSFVVDSIESSDCNGCPTEASVTFLCVDRNDPDYARPKLRPTPDLVIQDDRDR